MASALFYFPEAAAPAQRLARHCGIPAEAIALRSFPDGESLVRVPEATETALLYRSLDRSNGKLVELLLAASALRDRGARRVMLIAPYLGYMRQDMAFHPGEAVSQRVIGALIAQHFDGLVTVDPHLHRTASLAEVVPGIPALAISAAPVLAAALSDGLDPRTVLVGPDGESRPWVESIAKPLGLATLVGEKVRAGDRDVSLAIAGIAAVRERPVVLVDDCISSGATLVTCAGLLQAAGAARVEALVTHNLASEADVQRLHASGIDSLRATDSTAAGTIPLAEVLARAVHEAGWLGARGRD